MWTWLPKVYFSTLLEMCIKHGLAIMMSVSKPWCKNTRHRKMMIFSNKINKIYTGTWILAINNGCKLASWLPVFFACLLIVIFLFYLFCFCFVLFLKIMNLRYPVILHYRWQLVFWLPVDGRHFYTVLNWTNEVKGNLMGHLWLCHFT